LGPLLQIVDLAHNRFPITYDLPKDASDEARKSERERLARKLESAIRDVLDSEEYKSSLPKTPAPSPVAYRKPLQGRARFRPQGEAVGFSSDPLSRIIGREDSSVRLADGPAISLRVMPQQPLDAPLKITDLQRFVVALAELRLYSPYSNTFSVRGSDGVGLCLPLGDGPSPSLVFVFTDAEIWTINTYPLSTRPRLITLEETVLAESLGQCADFLNHRLNIPGPCRWVTGMEGVKGRSVPLPNDHFGRARGREKDRTRFRLFL
jgi:hypothetical protein